MVRAQNPQEAYKRGYADGLRMAEQMRWQGTPIGHVLKGSCYDPDGEFYAAYNDGFKQAMNAASRVEWTLPKVVTPVVEHIGTVRPKRWLSAA